jgi:hypothetical protein
MSDYETYLDEQETRLRELESKIDLVKTRAGMIGDADERAQIRERLVELNERMKLFTDAVGDLHESGSAWNDMRDSVEKAYMNVKESLHKASDGLIK